jgi:hypothetical protein
MNEDSELRAAHRSYKNPATARTYEQYESWVAVTARDVVVERVSRKALIEGVLAGLQEVGMELAMVERFDIEAGSELAVLEETIATLLSFDEDRALTPEDGPDVVERESLAEATHIAAVVLVDERTTEPASQPAVPVDPREVPTAVVDVSEFAASDGERA